MAIRIPYKGKFIECETPEEAEKMLAIINKQEIEERLEQAAPRTLPLPGNREWGMEWSDFVVSVPGSTPHSWTAKLFQAFIDRLGLDQQKILNVLVSQSCVTADDLRTAMGVQNNQALAGVISGISKQAAALDIPARAVFGIQNHRRSGELTKLYYAAPQFRKIAADMNWPHLPEK